MGWSPRSSPSWSRYRPMGGIAEMPWRLAAAALAVSFMRSARSRLVAFDDHVFRLVRAGQDAQYRVARETHPVVLTIAIRSAVLGGVVLHLALQAADKMRKRRVRCIVTLIRQRIQLFWCGESVAV